ncbi:MAG: hypothetical protein MUC62_10680, partial [Candidatus Thermoplasmatota archaeon]|nr:hypothetical protein [Candidatus Thermoplasmatota archaeon]
LFQRPGNMFFSTSVASEVKSIEHGDALLAKLGLEHLSERDPALLSEGEKQRLGLVLAVGSGAGRGPWSCWTDPRPGPISS